MLLFYIRHGDPIYSPDSLTSLGQLQAEALKKRLGVHGIDRIFSSTSNRAQLTAKPTAEMLKKEIVTLDFCHENYAYAELSAEREDGARTWCYNIPEIKELFVSEEMTVLGKRWYDHPRFSGTSFESGFKRIKQGTDEFLLSLGYRHDDTRNGYIAERPNAERVALFAHEGFGIAFLSALLDIPYPRFSTAFTMSHSGMTVIEFNNDDGLIIPRMLQLSNDSHIFAEGLPLTYQNRIYL